MWNQPSDIELNKIPRLYATEDVPAKDKVIHIHFFLASSDWYIAEFDGDDTFFGLVEGHEKELGYFSLRELQSVRGMMGLPIERDLYWSPKMLQEIVPEMVKD